MMIAPLKMAYAQLWRYINEPDLTLPHCVVDRLLKAVVVR